MLESYKKINGIVQYNTVIETMFPDYRFYPSVLSKMLDSTYTTWDMNLPHPNNSSKIILHTQDHLNVRPDNTLPELNIIEDFYKNTNLKDIIVIHWNHGLNDIYKGELQLIEFPTHSFDFVQHLVNRKNEWVHEITNRTNKYNFICLNGKTRDFRVTSYNYLSQLPYSSVITLGYDNSYSNAPYKNYDWDNADNFVKLTELYQGADVNIVNETLYHEECGIITEKTLNAFAALQVPVIISYKGIVSDIRNYGFDMFDDIVDHSYDTMDNDIRWRKAIELNMHLIRGEFDYDKLLPRLLRNQEYLFNGYLDFMLRNLEKHSTAI
jgi:hypothetical protein